MNIDCSSKKIVIPIQKTEKEQTQVLLRADFVGLKLFIQLITIYCQAS